MCAGYQESCLLNMSSEMKQCYTLERTFRYCSRTMPSLRTTDVTWTTMLCRILNNSTFNADLLTSVSSVWLVQEDPWQSSALVKSGTQAVGTEKQCQRPLCTTMSSNNVVDGTADDEVRWMLHLFCWSRHCHNSTVP